MDLEFKGTKGNWYIENEKHFILILAEGENQIADITVPKDLNDFNGREESETNAILIVEAGNVANETGLTPRQLLAQRDKLLEALQEMVKMWEALSASLPPIKDEKAYLKSLKAIQKVLK